MKHIIISMILLAAFNASSQDSAKHLSKQSISFAAGTNVTYPTSSYIPGGNWGGVPLGAMEGWASLGYSYAIIQTNHINFGCMGGIGYTQYRYNGKFALEITYGPPELLQQINEGEFYAGLFANTIIYKVGWYNELDLCGSSEVSIAHGSGFGVNDGYQYSNLPYGANFNLYLLYQTGFSIPITKNFSLTPLVSFPLINFSAIFYQSNTEVSQYSVFNAFSSFRTGLRVTYTFNKK